MVLQKGQQYFLKKFLGQQLSKTWFNILKQQGFNGVALPHLRQGDRCNKEAHQA